MTPDPLCIITEAKFSSALLIWGLINIGMTRRVCRHPRDG
jgi:hypothetical protein